MFPFQGSATNLAFSTAYSGHALFAVFHHDNFCNVRFVVFFQNLDPLFLALVSILLIILLVSNDDLTIIITFDLRESFSFLV